MQKKLLVGIGAESEELKPSIPTVKVVVTQSSPRAAHFGLACDLASHPRPFFIVSIENRRFQ